MTSISLLKLVYYSLWNGSSLKVVHFLRNWTVLGWELQGHEWPHIGKVEHYTHVNVLAMIKHCFYAYTFPEFSCLPRVNGTNHNELYILPGKKKKNQIFLLTKLKLDHSRINIFFLGCSGKNLSIQEVIPVVEISVIVASCRVIKKQ